MAPRRWRSREHGYDEHDGDTGNKDAVPFKDPNPVDIVGMGNRANTFMAKSVKGKTFFYSAFLPCPALSRERS